MLFGFGGDTGTWLPGVSPPGPPATWQNTQLPSFDCGPPVCTRRPFGAGLTKLMSSWQAAQARRLVAFFQLSERAAGARWHFTQLRTSCGYVTLNGSE